MSVPLTWPTGTEVSTFLTACGLTIPSGIDFDSAAAAAEGDFEKRSGFIPFLSGDPSARKYDPPTGRYLSLNAGLTSEPTVTMSGEALTENIQYWMLPANALAEGRPYTTIEFYWEPWGLPRSMVVTGSWGYAAELPADVKDAVLRAAAMRVLPLILTSVGGAIDSMTDAQTTIRFRDHSKSPLYSLGADPIGVCIETGGYKLARIA